MRIVGYIVGALVVLISLPLVLTGIVAIVVSSGFDVPLNGMTAPSKVVAIVSPEFTLKPGDLPSQVSDASVGLRITPAAGAAPLFVGLAPSQDVKRYLRNTTIAHPDLPKDANGNGTPPDPQTVLTGDGITMDLQIETGKRAKVAPPATRRFWIQQADSANGTITLRPADLEGKDVRVVVMRADGRPGLAFDAVATLHIPLAQKVGLILLAVGIALLALGAGLIVLLAVRGSRRKRVASGAAATSAPTAAPSASAATSATTDGPAPAVDTTPEPPAGAADPPA